MEHIKETNEFQSIREGNKPLATLQFEIEKVIRVGVPLRKRILVLGNLKHTYGNQNRLVIDGEDYQEELVFLVSFHHFLYFRAKMALAMFYLQKLWCRIGKLFHPVHPKKQPMF